MSRRATAMLVGLLAMLVLLPTAMFGNATANALADGGSGSGKSSKGTDSGGSKGGEGPGPFSLTKTLTRTFANDDGTSYDFPANTVTVDVDQTKNLRGRQRVNITWTGAQPSGGRSVNPYGVAGFQQEYPVLVLQCRGTDDPSLPVAQQVRPETCFTSTVSERSQVSSSDNNAPWRNDLDATPSEQARLSGLDPFPTTEDCPGADSDPLSTHLTPFIAASGKVYSACDPKHMPPEAATDAAFPPNEISAFTDENGNGSVRFEVRSNVENESLGCSDKVACSIVVLPINGLSCAAPPPATPSSAEATPSPIESSSSSASSSPEASPTPSSTASPTQSPTASPTASPTESPTATDGTPSATDTPTVATDTASPTASPSTDTPAASDPSLRAGACRQGGSFAPGTSNFASLGVDPSVSPYLWWSASNWKNRFSVPITFGLPPDVCDLLDPRPPTGFYGSELLAQAALQWSPAYCLNKKRFKFQLNQMSDDAGFNNMESGIGAAAVVSSQHKKTGDDPIGYAPTAVTGFGIGYNIDLPNNQGEYTNLKLNARLLAKLLTQSYPATAGGRAHPGLANNPLTMQTDPEFIALNPGLSQFTNEAGATLLSLSNSSDVIEQLTDYIAHDKDAAAFVDGKPDPWGMVVNPSYKRIKLPTSEFPLLDTFIPPTNDPCRQANPQVYFNQLAAPVTTLRKISDALLDGWPNTQTRCDYDPQTKLYKLGRVDRQNYGARFMLGIVSLGDQQRFGLRSAALQTTKDNFVGPNTGSLDAAVKLTRQAKRGDPFVLDQAAVRKSKSAYPGTMVLYTAAKTSGLDADTARDVALFMRTSTTEGQVEGSGNGDLPAGFVPITKTGATARLWASAQQVAAAVAKQADTKAAGGGQGGDKADTGTSGSALGAPLPIGAAPPTDTAVPTDVVATGDLPAVQPVAMPRTTALSSGLASRLLPLLLIIGILGLGAAAGTRFYPSRPRGRS